MQGMFLLIKSQKIVTLQVHAVFSLTFEKDFVFSDRSDILFFEEFQ